MLQCWGTSGASGLKSFVNVSLRRDQVLELLCRNYGARNTITLHCGSPSKQRRRPLELHRLHCLLFTITATHNERRAPTGGNAEVLNAASDKVIKGYQCLLQKLQE